MTVKERVTRFLVSTTVLVVTIASPVAGTTLFIVVNLVAIALIMAAIIGWDPVRFWSNEDIPRIPHKKDEYDAYTI